MHRFLVCRIARVRHVCSGLAIFNQLFVGHCLQTLSKLFCADNYEAAVTRSSKMGLKLFRVVTRFALPSGQAEDGSSALFTSRTEAIETAKKWAIQERATEV